MNRGIASTAGRIILLNEDFKCFSPDFGSTVDDKQDWYTVPLDYDPFGSQAWDVAYSGTGTGPFSLTNDGPSSKTVLTITASKDAAGQWHSGIINSMKHDLSAGFMVPPYFYAEATIKGPDATTGKSVPGTCPTFWFNTITPPGFSGNPFPTIEIDVLENSNDSPFNEGSTLHVWNLPNGGHQAIGVYPQFVNDQMSSGFHTWHVEITQPRSGFPSIIRFGYDGEWFWESAVPVQVFPLPFALMYGLALGQGGWPVPTGVGPYTTKVSSIIVATPIIQ